MPIGYRDLLRSCKVEVSPLDYGKNVIRVKMDGMDQVLGDFWF